MDTAPSSTTRFARSACIFALFISIATGCTSSKAPSVLTPSDRQVGYPPGPWWRGPVGRTRLGVAQILIAYDGAASSDGPGWTAGKHPSRTRAQALDSAFQLLAQLRRKPESFAELARSSSDDAPTAATGGELGTLPAAQIPAALIDALGNLKTGQISHVVETRMGFHIVRRLQAEPDVLLAGARIVIAYAGVEGFPRPDHVAVDRSREQAAALAGRVHERAIANGADFAALARELSDAPDAFGDGVLAPFYSYDTHPDPLRVRALRALAPGAVSPVIETRAGFEILRARTPAALSPVTLSAIVVGYKNAFNIRYPEISRSREEACASAQLVLREALSEPDSFEALKQAHCDFGLASRPTITVADDDSDFPGVAAAVAQVDVGQVVPNVLETWRGFVIARRSPLSATDAPPSPTPPEYTLELPRPAAPTIDQVPLGDLVRISGDIRDRGLSDVSMNAGEKQRFSQAFDKLQAALGRVAPEEREQLLAATNTELEALLGGARWRQFDNLRAIMIAQEIGQLAEAP